MGEKENFVKFIEKTEDELKDIKQDLFNIRNEFYKLVKKVEDLEKNIIKFKGG